MQDIEKRSVIWNVCLRHWKHLCSWERITQTICIPSKIMVKISLSEISEQLILEQSPKSVVKKNPWKQLSLVNDEEVISLSHAKFDVFLRFCVMSWTGESEPNIEYCLGTIVGMVQRFITIKNFGHNRRRADGIRVAYFPRIHHIAARRQSPRVHEQNGRPSTIPSTNYLHVDVQ